jgi:hypothetical protein
MENTLEHCGRQYIHRRCTASARVWECVCPLEATRWGGDGRRTVEQTRVIEIGTLRRAGYIGQPASNWWKWRDKAYVVGIWPSHWKGGCVQLPNQILRTVQVSWRFGGQRFYFVCECGRRVEKLHATSGRPWRCRHCYRLTYATRQATPRDRHIINVQKIREQLGGSPSLLDGFPPKPKGMHWRRYQRLRTRHDAETEQALGMTAARILRLGGRPRGS